MLAMIFDEGQKFLAGWGEQISKQCENTHVNCKEK